MDSQEISKSEIIRQETKDNKQENKMEIGEINKEIDYNGPIKLDNCIR